MSDGKVSLFFAPPGTSHETKKIQRSARQKERKKKIPIEFIVRLIKIKQHSRTLITVRDAKTGEKSTL
jgi:hypothetical protein